MNEWIYFNQFSGEDLSFYALILYSSGLGGAIRWEGEPSRIVETSIISALIDAGIIDA